MTMRTRRRIFCRLLITLTVLIPATGLQAQLAIQVPVVETVRGRFSGIVPDRGAVVLGGVSRGGVAYSRGGCGCPPGPGIGRFAESVQLSARVWIHDLHEMDQRILDAAGSGDAANRLRQEGLIDETHPASRRRGPVFRDDVLMRSRRSADGRLKFTAGSTDVERRGVGRNDGGPTVAAQTEATEEEALPRVVYRHRSAALKWLRLAKNAEESGNPSIAKLHYRQAARYGSALAMNRLKELSR